MDPYVTEVEQILSKLPQRTSKLHPESYIGGGQSKLRYLGLRMPDLHTSLKNGFSFSHLESREVAKIWEQVWSHSDCFEVMTAALLWFHHPKQRLELRQYWPILKKMSGKVDNWAHADGLSGIYAHILEDDSKNVLPVFEKWNQSKKPWLRRLSIVSLFYYSSHRERYLPVKKVLSLVKTQLQFDHYYVQKGVGWVLRESYNVYPKETFAFISEHIHILSAHAFSTSIEKMSVSQRQILKEKRRKIRSQS
ncbi:MAG: DNA alkylation repair protein [Pseudomonadota bacterium]